METQGIGRNSRDIADLTGKDHKHVIRDIRVMMDELQKDGLDFSHHFNEEKDVRGYTAIAIKFSVAIDFWASGYSRPSTVMPIRGVCDGIRMRLYAPGVECRGPHGGRPADALR